jgi:hypothetical protein
MEHVAAEAHAYQRGAGVVEADAFAHREIPPAVEATD